MINYSIVMRSVNANLFEINQAKSRVKAAQANGQAPARKNLDLAVDCMREQLLEGKTRFLPRPQY